MEGYRFNEIKDMTNSPSINTTLGRMRYALINIRKALAENKYPHLKELHFKD
jgi:hypothetical protein